MLQASGAALPSHGSTSTSGRAPPRFGGVAYHSASAVGKSLPPTRGPWADVETPAMHAGANTPCPAADPPAALSAAPRLLRHSARNAAAPGGAFAPGPAVDAVTDAGMPKCASSTARSNCACATKTRVETCGAAVPPSRHRPLERPDAACAAAHSGSTCTSQKARHSSSPRRAVAPHGPTPRMHASLGMAHGRR